jgi:hypothetical protein
MLKVLKYVGQGVVYALIAVLFGVFSDTPVYRHFPADKAEITLSLAHSGKHKGECRRLTSQEIAKLPPGERKPMDCARGRLPVVVELALDGKVLFNKSVPPSGLFGDGPSQVYLNFTVPAGRHMLAARLRDSDRAAGFDYERTEDVDIAPGQRLVIEFRQEQGGFKFARSGPSTGYRKLAQGAGRTP